MPGVSVVLAGVAAVLIYSAFKGVDPRSLFTSVFTGNPPTPLPGTESGISGSSAASGTVPGTQRGNASRVDGATPACARFVADLKATFGDQITSTGIVSVRDIAGSSTPSQHSFGNAVDIFSPVKDQIWAWAIRNNVRYSVRLVIYNRRQWYKGGISGYSGVNPHTDHVHVDFWPQYGGEPPGHPIGGKGF
jgi:hypothetical protein